SNHDIDMLKDGSYPWFLKERVLGRRGHLSNEEAGKVLSESIFGIGEIVLLAHLSQENNLPDLAYRTVKDKMMKVGLDVDNDITLGLSHRDRPTEVYVL